MFFRLCNHKWLSLWAAIRRNYLLLSVNQFYVI